MPHHTSATPFGIDRDQLTAALVSARDGAAQSVEIAAQRSNPLLQGLWQEIDATATAASSTPEPPLPYAAWLAYAERGDRKPYEDPYFARRTRLSALALSVGGGAEQHLPALTAMLHTICDEPTWALPAHVDDPATMDHRHTVDLFAAETGQALVEIRRLLLDRLSADVADRVAREVTERMIDPMRPGTPARWWETAPMNWAAVCGGAVLMAAVDLGEAPDQTAAVAHRCLGALDAFLDGFGDDGCCPEGVAYWSYGFGYFTAAADRLERATAGRIRIADDPRAVRAAAYGARVDLGPTRAVTYSDVGPGLPSTSIPVWWARRGVPPLSAVRLSLPSDDPCSRWALLVRSVLWSAELPHQAPAHVDAFPTTGLAVVNHPPYALALKAGHNDEPHNHLDLGHVAVWLGDTRLIADIGSGVYTSAYFGPTRYEAFLHPSAGAHNAPVLLSGTRSYEQRPGPDAHALLTVDAPTSDRGSANMDLSACYPPQLGVSALRTVTWSFGTPATLTIDDAITGGVDGAEVAFLSEAQPYADGHDLAWDLPDGTARLTPPEQAEVAVTRVDTADHDGRPETWWRITSRVVGDLRLTHRLVLAAR